MVSTSSSSAISGISLIGLAQQLVDASGRDGRVEAPLLHRRPDDQPAVRPAGPCRRARRRRSARRRARSAEPRRVRISPFTGRTGGLTSGGSQSSLTRPAAGRQYDCAAARSSCRRPSPGARRRRLARRRGHPRAGLNRRLRPGRARASSAATTRLGSTLASPGTWAPPRTAVASPGSSFRHAPPGQPLRRRGRAADEARSGGAGSSASSRSSATCSAPCCAKPTSSSEARSSSLGEAGPAAQRLEVEREQALLAPGRLPDRSQHPRGHSGRSGRRALAPRARIPGRRAAAARQAQASPITPPPTKIASYPLWSRVSPQSVRPRRSNLPAPALPGSGSDGRRRFSRPLSPWWAPVTTFIVPPRWVHLAAR